MADESLLAHIESLVEEEHSLQHREEGDVDDEQALAGDRKRLEEVEVELDRCWDLLRQRRAHEEFGLDPDNTSERPADVVEGYEQ